MTYENVQIIKDVEGVDKLRYVVTPQGVILFSVFDIAKGLKFTRTNKSGVVSIDTSKLNEHLQSLKIDVDMTNEGIARLTESDYYRLSYRSRSAEGLNFQYKMSTEIIPAIRKNIDNTKNDEEIKQLVKVFNDLNTKMLAMEIQLSELVKTHNQDVETITKLTNLLKDASYKINELSDQVKTTTSTVEDLTSNTKEYKLRLIKLENNIESVKTELTTELEKVSNSSSNSIINKFFH